MALSNFPELSLGSIKRILNKENLNYAILQIMGYKRVPGQGSPRFRLLLNDGETLYPFAILATQLNNMIEDKQLEKFTILKLNKYACTEITPDKSVIICLEIEPLFPGSAVNNQISLTQKKVSSVVSNTNQPPMTTNTPVQCNNREPNLMTGNSATASTSGQGRDNDLEASNIFLSETTLSPSKCISTQTTLSVDHHSNKNLVISSGPSYTSPTNVQRPIYNSEINIQRPMYNSGAINQAGIAVPIIGLTPYQNKWTVKARVVYKTSIVNYSNQRGSGKFFSFYLLDETGEIKAIAFNNQADLHNYLEVNKVYYISGGNVKPSKGNSVIKSDFEIMITESTKIELAEDEGNVPYLKFNFLPIAQIKTLSKDNYADVVGICCSVSNLRTIASKVSDREVYKVDLLLIDMGKEPITVSLWGSDAQEFKCDGNPIIVVRNARVTDFNGVSLSVSQASMLFINPDVQEALELKSWFDNLGSSLNTKSLAVRDWNSQTWKTFAELEAAHFEASDPAEYYMLKGTVVMINKERCMYRSCPSESCFKKVQDLENGLFKCEKCNIEYDSCSWTLLLSLHLADFSDSGWVVAFREIGESMIGYNSEQLCKMKEEDEDKYLEVLSALHFKSFIFKLRSKVEVFNEKSHLKTTVLEAQPVEPVSYTKKLLTDIERMERILSCE